MRIAVVTETYPPEINGVALTVQGFVEHLAAQGHAIDLVRPRQAGATAAEVGADASSAGISEILVRGAGLPRYPGLRFGLPAPRTLQARWTHTRPDAVYIATEGPLGWSALGVARRLGIPAATGFHTRFDDYASNYGLGLLTPLVFAWLRRFHNRAGATLVPTRELQSFLVDGGFRNVRLLTRGVDTHAFDASYRDDALRAQWGLAPDDVALIYVGRIAAEKNLELAVRSFRALQIAMPRARFVWVGDGPIAPALQREHPDFIFCGMRRGIDLARHFASGDVFVFPSLSETFGNVTLEAMASGVPVVAFDYGAARQHVRDGEHGRVVAADDSAGFIAGVSEIARDAALRQRMRAAARLAVSHLSPASVAAELAALLADLQPRRAA
jgi:glycosyltransferase involved in cell wall biosynthesis